MIDFKGGGGGGGGGGGPPDVVRDRCADVKKKTLALKLLTSTQAIHVVQ